MSKMIGYAMACAMLIAAFMESAHAQTTSRAIINAKVALPGIITTVAGNGTAGYSGDGGSAIAASMNNVYDVALDRQGNIYIADVGNFRVRKVDAITGMITTVAGGIPNGPRGNAVAHPISTRSQGILDIPATESQLDNPRGIAIDANGNLYIANMGYNQVRKVDAITGIVTAAVGDGFRGSNSAQNFDWGRFTGDGGLATEASISRPEGIAFDPQGNLIVADFNNHRIRKVNAETGIITTIAGDGFLDSTSLAEQSGRFQGDNDPAIQASLNGPRRVAVDANGNIFIADLSNRRVRRINAATGIITTVAGNGSTYEAPDGSPAVQGAHYGFGSIAVDKSGNLYISGSGRIRKVDAKTGIIATIAGIGGSAYSGDGGPAIQAGFVRPDGMAFDDNDNLYVADGNRVRKISPSQPIQGVRVEFARLVSGGTLEFFWAGTTNSDGRVEIIVDSGDRPMVSGYYLARAIDPSTGEIVGQWGSIPINSGRETHLDLLKGISFRQAGSWFLEQSVSMMLGHNHPNPFNPSTTIAYQLPISGDVSLVIYNVLGQQVRTLVSQFQPAGQYRVVWNGKDDLNRLVSSGVYFYRLTSNTQVQTRRMLLLK